MKRNQTEAEPKESAPELLPESALMWRCFVILSSQRHYSNNGPQAISLSDIHALAQIEELSPADARWFVDLVQTLDRIYLEDASAKISKEIEKRNKRNAGGAPRRGR